MVSVIIPTYNRAAYIRFTLASIAKQTYTHFECLIIDDGSTDNTRDILIDFCKNDSRFTYFLRPNNLSKGANSCRNFGISMSKGTFVSFCDDDDCWVSNKLELQLNIFKKHTHISVVTGDIAYINSEGVSLNNVKSHWPNNHGFVFKQFLIKNRTSMVTPMIKRGVFEKVGNFNTDFVIAEDWEFWRRVSYCFDFYSINEVLCFVRLHPENMTKTRTGKPFENYKLYRKLTKSLLKWGKYRFEPADYNLIYKIEWQRYRKLMANHYPGVLRKIEFLFQVFLRSITDGFHLIYLICRFNR
ncbi:glycosyltransferase [Lacinutrix sp. WUR7]|nr:glycosyltransferase [Lacinutrix sp. WUR7]